MSSKYFSTYGRRRSCRTLVTIRLETSLSPIGLRCLGNVGLDIFGIKDSHAVCQSSGVITRLLTISVRRGSTTCAQSFQAASGARCNGTALWVGIRDSARSSCSSVTCSAGKQGLVIEPSCRTLNRRSGRYVKARACKQYSCA